MRQRFSSGLLKISILHIRYAQMKYLVVYSCRLHLYMIVIKEIFFAFIFSQAFRKEVVFVIDIRGSMRDNPLEKTKYEVIGSIWKLNQGDSFNILASNGDVRSFSSSLELATEETITNATEWMNTNLVADGGTDLMLPLEQAIEMVGKTGDSIPLIFLITDGAVEDERDICNMMKGHIVDEELNSPRIFTFGIDSIIFRMQRLLDKATTPLLSNVTLDALENLESHELFPICLPDLWYVSPLIVSGRFEGNFPDIVKVRGFLGNLSTCVIDVKVRKAKEMPLDMVCARREIGTLTAHAWLDQDTKLEEKVAKKAYKEGFLPNILA